MKKKSLIAFCLFGYGTAILAQKAVPAAGGNATGSSGTVSYTVGQIAYSTQTSNSGTITQGVQQPFEIFIVTGIEEAKDISFECLAYPNPATGFVKLKVKNYSMGNLIYQLYDINGKLLESKKVEDNETIIPMENLVPSTYFLKIVQTKHASSQEVKTFKIIKN